MADAPATLPYGEWKSPLTAADVAQGSARIEWVDFVGEDVWWVESRPAEQGRCALVRNRAGEVEEMIPGWSVHSSVIEYGGRPWLALPSSDAEPRLVFANAEDERVYRKNPGEEPVPISPEPQRPSGTRYAEFAKFGDEVWCLREIIRDDGAVDARRDLVALPLDGSAGADWQAARSLVASHHFMTGPKIAPDGSALAWIGWNHPAMPWDGTELMIAMIGQDGELGAPRRLAGGPEVSITQVEWAADSDAVYAISDPGGWWNIHMIRLNGAATNLCARQEEFGEAPWSIGSRWFAPMTEGRLAVVHGTGERSLGVLHPDGTLVDVESSYVGWQHVASDGRRVAAVAGNPRERGVVCVHPDDSSSEIMRAAEIPHEQYLPTPRQERFTGPDGREVHAFVYPPTNPDCSGPAGELPPYVVHAHGGPTSRNGPAAHLDYAYLTSRGIGVLDVQYGGSTGYGRQYRQRLRGNWGVVDVEDCAAAARGLIEAGVADPDRIAIRGGSAGGWTAACSLVDESTLYKAASIRFPVLDLIVWRTAGTHDYESHYLESLVGPWPQERERYERRSPINRAERIKAPFLVIQGLEDRICPPAQPELLLERLGVTAPPRAYLTYAGEKHGFRKAENIAHSLEAELSLYGQAFGFEPPGIERVELGTGQPQQF